MIYLYNILSIVIIGTSLFAIDKDKKQNNSNKAPSYSYHMEPALSEIHANIEKREASATYKYSDGSKSTYYRYEGFLQRRQ